MICLTKLRDGEFSRRVIVNRGPIPSQYMPTPQGLIDAQEFVSSCSALVESNNVVVVKATKGSLIAEKRRQ